MPAIAPLQFLTFTNNLSSFAALVDPGSQLNLVSHALLPFLSFQSHPPQGVGLQGVSGKCRDIVQWITLPVCLENNHLVTVICADVTDLLCVVLFGLPFLMYIKAIHHIPGRFLATPYGPIPLISHAPRLPNCNTATIDEELKGHLTDSNLTEEQKIATRQLLMEFQELWRGGRRGQALAIAHRINLTHDRPIVSKPRPISEE